MMILISLILGLAYIWAMKRMSQYDSCEREKEKHWWLKAVAAILTLFISLVGADELLKAEGRTLGHTTGILSACLLLFGVVVYLINFKRSDSRWWSKLLKFVWGVFFFAIGFMTAGQVAAEDYRLMAVPAIIFVVMFIIITIVTSRDKSEAEEDEEEESHVNMDDVENFRFNEKEISESSQGCGDGKNNGRTGKKRESTIDTIGKFVAYIVGVVVIFLLVLCTVVESFSPVSSMESRNLEETATNAYQSSTVSEDQRAKAIAMLKSFAESHEPFADGNISCRGVEFSSEEKCVRYNAEFIAEQDELRRIEKFYEENENSYQEEKMCRCLLGLDDVKKEIFEVFRQAGYSLVYRMNFSSGKSVEAVITPEEINIESATVTKETIHKKLANLNCMYANVVNNPHYYDEKTGDPTYVEESELSKMKRKYEVALRYFIERSDVVMEYSEPENDGVDVESMKENTTEDEKKGMIKSFCASCSWAEDIAFSKCDIVLRYRGVRSGKVYDIRFPNSMILSEIMLRNAMKN